MRTRLHTGFTLIEMVMIMALAAILSAVAVTNFSRALAKGRDTRRKSDLKTLATALAFYNSRNFHYPVTSAVQVPTWYVSAPNAQGLNMNGGDWIPGLAPGYVAKLPNDPKGGPGNNGNGGLCKTWTREYFYASDGQNFKILSNCAPEAASWTNKDPFYDPAPGRATATWMICSGEPACSTW